MAVDLKALARLGAEKRYQELKTELLALEEAFPGLSSQQPAPVGRKSPAPKRRRRRTMSAEARKAVGERMRKYWAARRKAKSSKGN